MAVRLISSPQSESFFRPWRYKGGINIQRTSTTGVPIQSKSIDAVVPPPGLEGVRDPRTGVAEHTGTSDDRATAQGCSQNTTRFTTQSEDDTRKSNHSRASPATIDGCSVSIGERSSASFASSSKNLSTTGEALCYSSSSLSSSAPSLHTAKFRRQHRGPLSLSLPNLKIPSLSFSCFRKIRPHSRSRSDPQVSNRLTNDKIYTDVISECFLPASASHLNHGYHETPPSPRSQSKTAAPTAAPTPVPMPVPDIIVTNWDMAHGHTTARRERENLALPPLQDPKKLRAPNTDIHTLPTPWESHGYKNVTRSSSRYGVTLTLRKQSTRGCMWKNYTNLWKKRDWRGKCACRGRAVDLGGFLAVIVEEKEGEMSQYRGIEKS